MNSVSNSKLTEKIVKKAKSLGAAIAGVASVESLKASASHRIYPKIGMNLQVHWQDAKDDVKPHAVAWPADAVSVVVIGVEHNADKPELDWWDGMGTPGNRILMRINKKLSELISDRNCFVFDKVIQNVGMMGLLINPDIFPTDLELSVS